MSPLTHSTRKELTHHPENKDGIDTTGDILRIFPGWNHQIHIGEIYIEWCLCYLNNYTAALRWCLVPNMWQDEPIQWRIYDIDELLRSLFVKLLSNFVQFADILLAETSVPQTMIPHVHNISTVPYLYVRCCERAIRIVEGAMVVHIEAWTKWHFPVDIFSCIFLIKLHFIPMLLKFILTNPVDSGTTVIVQVLTFFATGIRQAITWINDNPVYSCVSSGLKELKLLLHPFCTHAYSTFCAAAGNHF